MEILGNNINIDSVISNAGKSIDYVYANNILVWQRLLTLELPQFTALFDLRTFIDNNNSKNHKRIVVINNLIQPTMVSGNLDGLDVTFINNGEIQGGAPGAAAIYLVSPIKITNNGWIRGAGNNGIDGSRGINGSRGDTSTDKTIIYDLPTISWTEMSSIAGSNQPGQGWSMTGNLLSGAIFTGPCGESSPKLSPLSNHPNNAVVCGSQVKTRASFVITMWTIEAGSYTPQKSHTIQGHAGGTGGIGGKGGKGGIGQSFNTSRTDGDPGYPGEVGKAGGTNSFIDPTGREWFGNQGGTGRTGENGTSGTNGGEWGDKGYAIVGQAFLLPESIIGNINGLVVNI